MYDLRHFIKTNIILVVIIIIQFLYKITMKTKTKKYKLREVYTYKFFNSFNYNIR